MPVRACAFPTLGAGTGGCKLASVSDRATRVLQALEAMPVVHGSLSVQITRSTMPFCCEQCGVVNGCDSP